MNKQRVKRLQMPCSHEHLQTFDADRLRSAASVNMRRKADSLLQCFESAFPISFVTGGCCLKSLKRIHKNQSLFQLSAHVRSCCAPGFALTL